jgi:hypothetical protein
VPVLRVVYQLVAGSLLHLSTSQGEGWGALRARGDRAGQYARGGTITAVAFIWSPLPLCHTIMLASD